MYNSQFQKRLFIVPWFRVKTLIINRIEIFFGHILGAVKEFECYSCIGFDYPPRNLTAQPKCNTEAEFESIKSEFKQNCKDAGKEDKCFTFKFGRQNTNNNFYNNFIFFKNMKRTDAPNSKM